MPFSIAETIAKVIKYRRNGETLVKEHPETEGVQVLLAQQNGVTTANVQTELEALHTAVTSLSNALAGKAPVEKVPNITARDALTGKNTGDLVWVIDATSDATVASGAALYLCTVTPGANEGDPATTTWTKLAEAESMDLVVDWADVQNKEVDVMHVASMPASMPTGLADGGLLIVDVAAA